MSTTTPDHHGLHIDLLDTTHQTVEESASIEGSPTEVCGSPFLSAKPSQRLGLPSQVDDTIRTCDVMAISALMSSMTYALDEFIASLKEFCQRHAVPVTIGEGNNTSQKMGKSVAGDFPALHRALAGETRFCSNEPLLELAERVDHFFSQTAPVRDSAKKVSQKLSNRNATTQSFAFLGNSRFTSAYMRGLGGVRGSPPTNSAFDSHRVSMQKIASRFLPNNNNNQPGSTGGAGHGSAKEKDQESRDVSPDSAVRFVTKKQVTPPQQPISNKSSSNSPPQSQLMNDSTSKISQHMQKISGMPHVESMNSMFSTAGRVAVQTATADVTRDTQGNKLINEYIVLGELGRGAYGKVKLAEHKVTKELVAIKIMNKSMLRKMRTGVANGLQQVQTEIAVMKKLRHRNIVNLYEVIDDPESNKMYLVMQYIEKGPVLKLGHDGRCQPLSDELARDYAKQLAAGINFLHRHNVIHRDIKPDNILVGSNSNIVLSDFGVSEILDDDSDEISDSRGTPAFMSPELWRGEGSVHGKAVDMWALGVTLYAFVFGRLPFFGPTIDAISHAVQNESVKFPPDADEEWVTLLSALLNKDPNRRMSAGELRQSPILFGNDGLGQSRRASALDVVFVDEDDIASAIAVGNVVHLCCRKSPKEKLRDFVNSVRRRAAMHKESSIDTVAHGENPVLQVDVVTTKAHSPHPPSPNSGKDLRSPSQRSITREASASDVAFLAVEKSPSELHNSRITGAQLRMPSLS